MNILIVDDEAPARGELKFIVESLEPQANVTEARHGEEALRLLEELPIDLVFLDINMPVLDGLGVAKTLILKPDPPLIVFATAYDDYALKAFDFAALDYVVKPFDEVRLKRTLERVRQIRVNRELKEKNKQNIQTYLHNGLNKLWVERENENRFLLEYQGIYWFKAKDKKVFAHTYSEHFILRYTLKELETLLLPHQFLRVHKAYVVNLNHIAEVVPWLSGNYRLRMKDKMKTELSLSRRYAARLKELTGWR